MLVPFYFSCLKSTTENQLKSNVGKLLLNSMVWSVLQGFLLGNKRSAEISVIVGFHPLYLCGILMRIAVIAKIIFGMPDKMSGRPSALCRTF